MKHSIDLNCDLGEGRSISDCQKDAELMPYLSSCNIACGGHAGNRQTISKSIENAIRLGLSVGAHPGYPDQQNFGRVSLQLSPHELIASLDIQLRGFIEIANTLGVNFSHIKLHGALYNDMEKNEVNRLTVVDYFKRQFPSKKIYGLAGGKFQAECESNQLKFVPEGFIDRNYLPNGQLMPRTKSNAVIHDSAESAKRAILFARKSPIDIPSGSSISIDAKTLCIHSDSPNALSTLTGVYQALKDNNIEIVAPR